MTTTFPDRPASQPDSFLPARLPDALGDAIDDRVAEALDDYLAEGRLDGRVRPRRSPGGIAVLVAAGVAAVLLPWCLILAATLPSTYQANHWKLAWIGLDCGTAIAAAFTAYLLHKQDIRAALSAAAAGPCSSPTPGSTSVLRVPASTTLSPSPKPSCWKSRWQSAPSSSPTAPSENVEFAQWTISSGTGPSWRAE